MLLNPMLTRIGGRRILLHQRIFRQNCGKRIVSSSSEFFVISNKFVQHYPTVLLSGGTACAIIGCALVMTPAGAVRVDVYGAAFGALAAKGSAPGITGMATALPVGC